jgi:hypothetical protein
MSLIRSNTRVNKQSQEQMPEFEHDHRKSFLITSRIIQQLHLNSFGCWSRWWLAKREIRSFFFSSSLYPHNTSKEQLKKKAMVWAYMHVWNSNILGSWFFYFLRPWLHARVVGCTFLDSAPSRCQLIPHFTPFAWALPCHNKLTKHLVKSSLNFAFL